METNVIKKFNNNMEVDNGYIVLNNVHSIDKIELDNEEIVCYFNVASENIQLNILEITNKISNLGKNICRQFKISKSCNFNVYSIRDKFILNSDNITSNINKNIVSFIKNFYVPYNTNSNEYIMNNFDFVMDCIIIYKILYIKKNIKEIVNTYNNFIQADDDIQYAILQCKLEVTNILDKTKNSLEILNKILDFEINKETNLNISGNRKYNINNKKYLSTGITDNITDLELMDIINNSKLFQQCCKLLEVLVNISSSNEVIGNITINNLIYSIEQNKFISYLSAHSLMSIAYYGVSMFLISDSGCTLEICCNPQCFNLFERKRNTHQCGICLNNNKGRNTRDYNKKLHSL